MTVKMSKISTVGVVGAGQMGNGIAHVCALAGYDVLLSDADAGRIDNAQIPALYAAADVMLNPSTVDNMPISILEAFASGVPVVSTDVGGVPFIAEDGRTALLVPARDPAQMAGAMLRILQDRPLAVRLAAAARDEVKQYAWPVVRQKWLAVYRRLARNR